MKIRSEIVRTYQAIHSWTGISTGLLLFICFFAGALTMFQSDIQRWADAGIHQVGGDAPTEVAELDALLRQTIRQHQDSMDSISVALQGEGPLLSWHQGRPELGSATELHYASLNDGEVEYYAAHSNQLAKLIDELHRTAGIAGELGHEHLGVYVMGVAAIAYFLALVSGVIFLLPTLARSFLALRHNKGRFRFLLDTHNLVGVVSLPFHIIIAFTVVVFAFHDQFYAGLSAVYDDRPLFEHGQPDAAPYAIEQLPPLTEFIAVAGQQMPDYQLHGIHFSGLGTLRPSARLELVNNDRMMINPVGDILMLHPFTLQVTYSTNPTGAEGIWGRVVSSFFSLHFGSYGGEWTRWVYFILGLGGAYLFYSGNLLWLEKRRQQKKSSPRVLSNMTALTLGVCYGCMAGIASAMVIGRLWPLLPGTDGSQINAVYIGSYYLVFAGCVLWAFWRRAARAVVELKRFCAATFAAIALVSWSAGLLPVGVLAQISSGSGWVLELLALAFAVVLLLSANHTRRSNQFAYCWRQAKLSGG
ncbi:peptidase [Bacterioplanes sanyensis]|uniref:Peptidase n=1 Tax=Bacterioplanes sanyensis TaxID=1249553 RepID=A0A222FH87_9GAMM|nr:PepSY-associated TM helix domain-containing protein [Bacterioplanes sanyensis]ASP37946.1 peptidase [Bacterioplanes sanyensis]